MVPCRRGVAAARTTSEKSTRGKYKGAASGDSELYDLSPRLGGAGAKPAAGEHGAEALTIAATVPLALPERFNRGPSPLMARASLLRPWGFRP